MKILSLLSFALLLLPLSLSAQNVVVELESVRVFYRGVDNPINIAVDNHRQVRQRELGRNIHVGEGHHIGSFSGAAGHARVGHG